MKKKQRKVRQPRTIPCQRNGNANIQRYRSLHRTKSRRNQPFTRSLFFHQGDECTIPTGNVCHSAYYEKTQDIKFVEEMYPVMQRIISGYERGTNFNIHMEEDGLISAGAGLDQVTWMDVPTYRIRLGIIYRLY